MNIKIPGIKYYNTNVLLGALITLVASCSQVPLHWIEPIIKKFVTHNAFVALVNGLIIALVTYIPLQYVSSKNALSSCILLGLLVAKLTVYGNKGFLPGLSLIGFFFLMYYSVLEESEHNLFNATSH